MELFTDEVRAADANNPKGYYEHDAVKTLRHNKAWLPLADGKAVKVVAPLLPHLPPSYRYKIIFMERDLDEVVQSQRRMLKRLGKPVREEVYPEALLAKYEAATQRSRRWMSSRPNVQVLYVPYAEVLAHPFREALRVREFVDRPLVPEHMVQAVDRQLYRERKLAWPA